MQLPNDIVLAELTKTVEKMQSRMRAQQFEIESLRTKHKQLNADHQQLKDQLECTNTELEWIDKRAFVAILDEMGLMTAARAQSQSSSADNMRYLSRLMREWHIFRIHDEGSDPPLSKHVWKLSTKKLLFHKSRAVEQFRVFTKMRSQFDRTS